MRVLGGVGWDRKKSLDSNLHVYVKDDTQIVVYNIKRWPREKRSKKKKKTPEKALGANY